MKPLNRRTFVRRLATVSSGICAHLPTIASLAATGEHAPDGTDIRTLHGCFGHVDIDVKHPSLARLFIRQVNGALAEKSLLSQRPAIIHPWELDRYRYLPEWAVGGTSYVVSECGRRFSSRFSQDHQVEIGATNRIQISNIQLRPSLGDDLVAVEDWTLEISPAGGFRWEIRRRFTQHVDAAYHGGPCLFFNASPEVGKTIAPAEKRWNPAANAVSLGWWIKTDQLVGERLEDYASSGSLARFLPTNQSCTMLSDKGWAVLKLYSSFPLDQDLRVQGRGGHLYRRGAHYAFTEVGMTAGPSAKQKFRKGEEITLALEMTSMPQSRTGQQLRVSLPDKKMEHSLRNHFAAAANSACLADTQNHYFGNQSDGYFYSGNLIWHAYSLLASMPSCQPLSSAPLGYGDAFRKYLKWVLGSVNQHGEVTFGYMHNNEFPELSMSALMGLEAYLLHSGDLALLHEEQSVVERIDTYLRTWLQEGVFYAPKERIQAGNFINWYYDIVVGAHGYTLYHNLFYAQVLDSLKTIYQAAGNRAKAQECLAHRQRLVELINDLFWDDHAYGMGQGGYYDWILEEGEKRGHFFSTNQYRAILFGVADGRQSCQILHTADTRIAELQQYFGYTYEGTLDCLWPLRNGDIARRFLRFGTVCDGGLLLANTFWEVMARCTAGDADGACGLLQRFSRRASRTNWFEGTNSFAPDGQPHGWSGEPYLADEVIVPTSAVLGFLGLEFDWENLSVNPRLPAGWKEMSATVLFKGIAHKIRAHADGTFVMKKLS